MSRLSLWTTSVSILSCATAIITKNQLLEGEKSSSSFLTILAEVRSHLFDCKSTPLIERFKPMSHIEILPRRCDFAERVPVAEESAHSLLGREKRPQMNGLATCQAHKHDSTQKQQGGSCEKRSRPTGFGRSGKFLPPYESPRYSQGD